MKEILQTMTQYQGATFAVVLIVSAACLFGAVVMFALIEELQKTMSLRHRLKREDEERRKGDSP